MAYDYLSKHMGLRADKEYLKLLYLAKNETEIAVESAIKELIRQERAINAYAVQEIIESPKEATSIPEVLVEGVTLEDYDKLLSLFHEEAVNE